MIPQLQLGTRYATKVRGEKKAQENGNSTLLSHNNYDVVIRNVFYEFLSTSNPVLQLSPGNKATD